MTFSPGEDLDRQTLDEADLPRPAQVPLAQTIDDLDEIDSARVMRTARS